MSTELHRSPRFEKPVERRDFLGLAAMISFLGTLASAAMGVLRLPIPSVFPETDSRFPIGKPQDFPAGQSVFLARRRLWVFSDQQGIRAVSTVCPHLGCLVHREPQGDFTCPCHGSHFDPEGQIVGGPSPRGLVWVEVSLGPDGRLLVDSEREVDANTHFKA